MNGIHDMGGMHGFGQIVIEPNDGPLSLADWEKRADTLLGVTMGRGLFNIDAFRYGIELIEPARYLQTPYFGRWAASIEWNLIREGVLTQDEIDARTDFLREHPETDPPPSSAPLFVRPEKPPGEPLPPQPPRFAVGDVVMTRNAHPSGHTRLPRYIRGKRGVIDRINPPEPFADARADNLNAPMQVTYHVRFAARDLWGDAAEPDTVLSIDLYDSYLSPDGV